MPNNQPNNPSQSEHVRDLFNKRATAWSELYRENQKLVWRLEEFYTGLAKHVPQPAKVLDFGCGAGNLATSLYVHGYQVTACDIAEKMIAEARETFVATSIEWVNLPTEWQRLPFADNAFDGVIASSVFEYLADLDLAFGELARVLRPGGVVVFSVPNMEHRERKFEQWVSRLATGRWIHGLARSIPQVRNYLDYLRLSRNRFPLKVWEERAAVHKFRSCSAVSDLSLERPLLLLSLQKMP
jgi:ubiquinone/menaquinone biosynthesis C-methylase UbiE